MHVNIDFGEGQIDYAHGLKQVQMTRKCHNPRQTHGTKRQGHWNTDKKEYTQKSEYHKQSIQLPLSQ